MLVRPYLDMKELAQLMGINPKSLQNSIYREQFPIPTYKLGKHRVADKKVVDAFFKTQRDIGMEKISTNK